MPCISRTARARALKVDLLLLKTSVHGKLSCSDCHFGFSSEEHPQRNFRTRAGLHPRFVGKLQALPLRQIHQDAGEHSLHLLSQGKLNAPVCTDCHGSHDISRIGKERSASAKRCQRCHSEGIRHLCEERARQRAVQRAQPGRARLRGLPYGAYHRGPASRWITANGSPKCAATAMRERRSSGNTGFPPT